jgi:hypothetical protein
MSSATFAELNGRHAYVSSGRNVACRRYCSLRTATGLLPRRRLVATDTTGFMELAVVAVEIVDAPDTTTDAVVAPQQPVVNAATGRATTASTFRCPSILGTQAVQPIIVSGSSQNYTQHGQHRLP